jgi:hypothetical protein
MVWWCVFGWVQELLEDGEVKELALLREGGDDVADYLVQESLGTLSYRGPWILDIERPVDIETPRTTVRLPETLDDSASLWSFRP